MANRLSVITTRTGDDGSTGLGDGSRVSKDSVRVCAMGEVDELNSSLGLLIVDLQADPSFA
jgi:cob(I)alamin adenosyltransferase